ncbi:type II secretion system F family protein [Candidatus Endomicrobiellum agilis]|jgi:tight adherence protein C|uniref:type II secretion system F family protein n=1 Tax=Candidatus Endomicrobiellum agilis TaxID=3238957 RepID=UPI0028443BBA|nr:type II secretion system F family protein [Endomicrobium sp.]MDR3092657.1 type II secretion system F family protein [Endomicrobium sp.]
MIVLSCVFSGLFVFFMVYYLLVNIRIMEIAGRVHNAVEKRESKSFILPVIMNNAEKLGRLIAYVKYRKFTVEIDKIGVILKSIGGSYERVNPYQFFALQLFTMIAGVLFVVILISTDIFVILLFGLIFFFLPLLKIREEVKKRKELIARQLPDMADLLSVMLDAGLDFYGAAEKVIQILQGPLADEFRSALAKVSLGYDKKAALTEMVQKTEVEQLGFFVRTVNMSLESGTGMSDTLKRLTISLRNERTSSAEKKAQEAPVKMLIPLVLLIFPTIFIVIFGPIVINFIKTGF